MNDKLGTLYLVPTPIGNLQDMSFRAVETLKSVDLVAAEDTRHSRILLGAYDISKPMISYHEHNKAEVGPKIIEELLAGKNVAMVSDAGMPAISDPGADLAALAIEAGINIIPLPGPNAALTALMVSGLDTREFTFVGFLPKRAQHRRESLTRLASYEGTLLFYEAPHRLREVLAEMLSCLGDRPVAIARELTKKYESFVRTTLSQVVESEELLVERGEFVIIVGGAHTAPTQEGDCKEEVISPVEAVAALVSQGVAKKEAIRQVAKERGLARRAVYQAVEEENREG